MSETFSVRARVDDVFPSIRITPENKMKKRVTKLKVNDGMVVGHRQIQKTGQKHFYF